MLRINAVSDAGYYLTASGEWDRAGAWDGKSADRLGIAGTEGTTAFRRLMGNRTPDGSKLTPRDHPDRRLGYDLTFSEPKSVSILRELAGDDRIERAREESVREIMRDVVEPLAATRERRLFGNHPVTTGNLAWTAFHHRLGRPIEGMPDMNGHTHVVIPNATESRGRFMAIEIRPIMEAAPFIQAAWHANFAAKLKGLGYDIRPTKDAFEVVGITQSMIVKFSRRTAQVEAEQARRECDLEGRISRTEAAAELEELYAKLARVRSPKAKAGLGAKIRELKGHDIDPEVIRADWASRLTPAEHAVIERTHRKALDTGANYMANDQERLAASLEFLLRTDSAVPEKTLLSHALRFGPGEATLGGLKRELEEGDYVRASVGGVDYVTTREAVGEEMQVLAFAESRRGERPRLSPLDSFQRSPFDDPLHQAGVNSGEIRDKVSRVWRSRDPVTLLRTKAGVERTQVTAAIKAGLEGERLQVIPANQLHATLDGDDWKRQTSPSVVWVEGAERVRFKDLHRLTEWASLHNARLVLSGGLRDHREADRGKPMAMLEDLAGLKTGQERPGIVQKAARVSRQVVAKVKRHLERGRKAEFVKSLEVGDVGPRQAERGWSR